MAGTVYFDTHVHLDQPEFDADREAVIQRAISAGVETMLCVGIGADSSQAALQMAQSYSCIFAAAGIHPNYAAQARPDDWDRVVRMVDHPRCVAIGETGLDRHWDFTPFPVQQDYFDRHLQLARQRQLPVIIHCRDAEAELLPMLREAATRAPLRGVLHAFGGTAELAEACLGMGLDLSFAGNVTYPNKKFESLRATATTAPVDRVLAETDSPYLVPQAMRGKGRRNEPAWVTHTVEGLAKLRGVPVEELAACLAANARRLFGIPA